jgi:hypothetical protein
MKHYARIDANNVVVEVLKFNDSWDLEAVSGRFGRPGTSFVETFDDGTRYRYAQPGCKYLPEEDVFTTIQIPAELAEDPNIEIRFDPETYAYYLEYVDIDIVKAAVAEGTIVIPEEFVLAPDILSVYS